VNFWIGECTLQMTAAWLGFQKLEWNGHSERDCRTIRCLCQMHQILNLESIDLLRALNRKQFESEIHACTYQTL